MKVLAGLFGIMTVLQCFDLIRGVQEGTNAIIATAILFLMFLIFFIAMHYDERNNR